jgi:hypothetical protein
MMQVASHKVPELKSELSYLHYLQSYRHCKSTNLQTIKLHVLIYTLMSLGLVQIRKKIIKNKQIFYLLFSIYLPGCAMVCHGRLPMPMMPELGLNSKFI